MTHFTPMLILGLALIICIMCYLMSAQMYFNKAPTTYWYLSRWKWLKKRSKKLTIVWIMRSWKKRWQGWVKPPITK